MKTRRVTPLIAVALLRALPLFPLDAVSPELTDRMARNVFEVVVRKPEADPLGYAERLPLELLPFADRNDPYYSVGTAFALSDGRFVSAGHVFSPHARTLQPYFGLRDAAGDVHPIGDILAYSFWRDYIVFEVPGLRTTGLRDVAAPKVNARVFTVGNALGEGVVIRDGTLTSLTPEERKGAWKWLRFTAPASPGNSGGPLTDGDGNVIGVVLRRSENENLNYALPITEIARDSKAHLEERFTCALPNSPASSTIEGATEIDLPLSLDALRAGLTAYQDRLYQEAVDGLASRSAQTLLSGSGKVSSILGDSRLIAFPSFLVQQPDGSWKIEAAGSQQKATLGKDGSLTSGEHLGFTLMSLGTPSGTDPGALLAEPRKLAELILQGYLLTRQVADKQVRITSFGEPAETRTFTDRWGRPWLVAAWHVPLFDRTFTLFCLPVPNGVLCAFKRSSYGDAGMYEADFRILADYVHVSYSGTAHEWTRFLSPGTMLPALFTGWKLSYAPGKFLSVENPHFTWYGGTGTIDASDENVIRVMPGFFAEDGALAWDMGGFALSDSSLGMNSLILMKTLRPGESATAQEKQVWDSICTLKMPFDGRVHRANGCGMVCSVKLPGLGEDRSNPPLFAQWLTIALDESLDDATLLARSAAIAGGLRLDPREKLRAFASRPADPAVRDGDGATPVMAALRANDIGLVTDLVAAGADIGLPDADGVTPLMLSMDRGFGDLPLTLMDRGADATAAAKDGRTALDYALRNGRDDVARLLVSKGVPAATSDAEGMTPLLLAVRHHAQETLQLLLHRTPGTSARTVHGWTMLHVAARFSPDLLPSVLAADPALRDARTDRGATALSLAIQYADADTVRRLLDAGADAAAANNAGWTLLMWALRHGSDETVEMLLATGRAAAGTNDDGWNALHFAARYRPSFVPRLGGEQAPSADAVNALTRARYSPLHLAVIARDREAVLWLLAHGADTRAVNREGKTAADIASDNGDASLARLINSPR